MYVCSPVCDWMLSACFKQWDIHVHNATSAGLIELWRSTEPMVLESCQAACDGHVTCTGVHVNASGICVFLAPSAGDNVTGNETDVTEYYAWSCGFEGRASLLQPFCCTQTFVLLSQV